MHLCVDAQYASGGERAGEQLLLRLVRELRRSTRRLKGVRKLELYYVKGRTPGSRFRLEGKAAAV
jgi:hypothetical protein